MKKLKSLWANFRLQRGLIQLHSARRSKSHNVESLYEAAIRSFAAAAAADPNIHEALHQWGLALYELAPLKAKKEAKSLWAQASQKFAAALDISAHQPKILNDWGAALMAQARSKPPNTRNATLRQAEQKLLAAEQTLSGIAAYNLACISSLNGDEQACEKYLVIARDYKQMPDAERVGQDADLANVRGRKWFKKFVKTLE